MNQVAGIKVRKGKIEPLDRSLVRRICWLFFKQAKQNSVKGKCAPGGNSDCLEMRKSQLFTTQLKGKSALVLYKYTVLGNSFPCVLLYDNEKQLKECVSSLVELMA